MNLPTMPVTLAEWAAVIGLSILVPTTLGSLYQLYRQRPRLLCTAHVRYNPHTSRKEVKIAMVSRGQHGTRIRSVRLIRAANIGWIYRRLVGPKMPNLTEELADKKYLKSGNDVAPGQSRAVVVELTPELEEEWLCKRLALRVHSNLDYHYCKVNPVEQPPLNLGPDV